MIDPDDGDPSGTAHEPDGDERSALEARHARLAEEKAHLQLIVWLIEQLNPRPGVDAMVDALLENLVATMGGTDCKLWYRTNGSFAFAGFRDGRRRVDGLDDPLAARVASERAFVEVRDAPGESLVPDSSAQASYVWCFPLLVGQDLLGVVKLEHLQLQSLRLCHYLPAFFAHVALLLGHELAVEERRRAEAARRQATEELARYFDGALDLFCIADMSGSFVRLNRAWTDVLGYEVGELEGRPFLELVHPDDRPATEAAVAALRAQEVVRDFQNRYRHKRGEWRWMEWRSQRSGERIYAAARDVTERRAAADAQRLAACVFANSQQGILITDAEGRIIDVNEGFVRISGYGRDEVLGQNPRILKSGRHEVAFYEAMWRQLMATGSWKGEIYNKRKSGQIFPELLTIDAARDAAGRVEHFVGAFTDITRQKATEEELARLAHHDALTGLANRRLIVERLKQELARAGRGRRELAICYVDLDGFKPVNDELGHDAGDSVLIEVARRLEQCVRWGDVVGRVGGDEFVILLTDLGQEFECFEVLERVIAAVARPLTVRQRSVTVTASVGVTLFPRDDADAETLLRHADAAMYQAKSAGRAQYRVHGSEGREGSASSRPGAPTPAGGSSES